MKQNERNIVEQKLSLANSLPLPKIIRGDLTIEMAEMFKNNPQLTEVWNKHRSDFNVMETSYLPSGVA